VQYAWAVRGRSGGGGKPPLCVVGGSNWLLGRRPREEAAADLLAITLQFDDVLSAGDGDARIITLRVTAVRLFLALLELYERSMLVIQPTSHPPAAARWGTIVSDRLARWLGDMDELQLVGAEMITAFRELSSTPPPSDTSAAHSGLGDRLDRKLWSFYDWSQAATLGHLLIPAPPEALDALTRWPGWCEGALVEAEIELVAEVLASDVARNTVWAAASGSEVVSRLEAATALTAHLDAARNATDFFPSWAIALTAIAETISEHSEAS
jgi:hypothetical protein